MSVRDFQLDEQLGALFGGLDAAADFDARLMARLRAESQADTAGRAVRAREQERARYRRALLELHNWRRSMLSLLTLDTLGIACLLAIVAVATWPSINRLDVMSIWRHYGPYIATLLGVLIAAVPVAGMWAERTRSSIRLL